MKNKYEQAKTIIRRIISKSPVPEDNSHAENALQWLYRLAECPGISLELAVLAHDIERAIPYMKVNRQDFSSYDSFKATHAKNSAKILNSILEYCRIESPVIKRSCKLVARHETGGTSESDLLKDADSISFFDNNIFYYFDREGYHETVRRCTWGYKRLSPRMRDICRCITYDVPVINKIVKEAIKII